MLQSSLVLFLEHPPHPSFPSPPPTYKVNPDSQSLLDLSSCCAWLFLITMYITTPLGNRIPYLLDRYTAVRSLNFSLRREESYYRLKYISGIIANRAWLNCVYFYMYIISPPIVLAGLHAYRSCTRILIRSLHICHRSLVMTS